MFRKRQSFEKRQGIPNRHFGNFTNVFPVDFDRKRTFVQSISVTRAARQTCHVLSHHVARKIAVRFTIAPLDVVDYAFKYSVDVSDSAKVVFMMKMKFLVAGTVQNEIFSLFGKIFKGRIHVNSKSLARLLQKIRIILRADRIPWCDSSFMKRLCLIRNNQIHVNLKFGA